MKNRKLVALLLGMSLIASALSACGGTGASEASETESSSAASTAESENAGEESSGAEETSDTAGDTALEELVSAGDTITVICPYGVGGTADAVAREYAAIASELYPDYNFVVENVTGGDGFTAAIQYVEEDPNTTDLFVYGYGVAYRHDLGNTYGTEIVEFDRSEIQPIATIDDRTWILYTTPDSSLADIIEKAQGGNLKMSGGNPLSDPHLALGSLLALLDGTVSVVPYDGGAAQIKALTDGEVDVFVGSTQAGQEYVEAGTVVPVLAFSEEAFTGFVDENGETITVPSIAGDAIAEELDPATDYTGSILPAGGYIATRTGASDAWVNFVTEVSEAVWASGDFTDWLGSVLLNDYEIYNEEAQSHLEEGCQKALAAYELLSAE